MLTRIKRIFSINGVSIFQSYDARFPLVRYCSNVTSTFVGVRDRFNGITVDCHKEFYPDKRFKSILLESLEKWTSEGRRCIWFKVNIKDASFVPQLAENGFNFHHARDDYVMMYKWLPKDSKANIPPSSHTNLGVGAMVFNDKNKILAISEKHYEYPHWKLPGGYVERGEHIISASVREVKEETGIDAEFRSLVTFRHTHKMMFDNSDIYILLRMHALSEDITISQREVLDCKWMDIEEYTTHPHVHEFNRLVVRKAIEHKNKKIKLDLPRNIVQWANNTRDMSYLMIEETDK